MVEEFFFIYLGGGGEGGGRRGQGRNVLGEFDTFFGYSIKNTSNLIFPSFKVPFKSFFHNNFKTGLIF